MGTWRTLVACELSSSLTLDSLALSLTSSVGIAYELLRNLASWASEMTQ